MKIGLFICAVMLSQLTGCRAFAGEIFVRVNQLGYPPRSPKTAIAFSASALPSDFILKDSAGGIVFRGKIQAIPGKWGQFANHGDLDFSAVQAAGTYIIQIGAMRSFPVQIHDFPYAPLPLELLQFMREQRCGYNPWLEIHCHQLDGRTAYGPRPAGTAIDVTGGWHDAGDMLKYLITSEDATANMLLAYQLNPGQLSQDHYNSLGQPHANGIPDVLDEAKWGLDWMLKMHPAAAELYHQVGDDRDHAGWRLPQNDRADYGWGKGKARVVYCADGQQQGLRQYKSESNGIANIAGIYSAAMALGFEIFRDFPGQKEFANRCLRAGQEVYALGRAHEGVQQGNSYGSPYRYGPTIWACDMEWGAAELYRVSHDKRYLTNAIRYAKIAADETWMGKIQTGHYQYFPFVNVGHYRLYDLIDGAMQKTLAGYYRSGIDRCVAAGNNNPYHIGIPFIWCSNNLAVALATQCAFYQRMTGDAHYEKFAAQQRDWLLGRNPWGTTMFTEIGIKFPRDVHLMTVQLLHRPVPGALVDGPVYSRIFQGLQGVSIHQPDSLAAYQGPCVYHDDGHDYSTNEPTLDGTASAILMFALESARQ